MEWPSNMNEESLSAGLIAALYLIVVKQMEKIHKNFFTWPTNRSQNAAAVAFRLPD